MDNFRDNSYGPRPPRPSLGQVPPFAFQNMPPHMQSQLGPERYGGKQMFQQKPIQKTAPSQQNFHSQNPPPIFPDGDWGREFNRPLQSRPGHAAGEIQHNFGSSQMSQFSSISGSSGGDDPRYRVTQRASNGGSGGNVQTGYQPKQTGPLSLDGRSAGNSPDDYSPMQQGYSSMESGGKVQTACTPAFQQQSSSSAPSPMPPGPIPAHFNYPPPGVPPPLQPPPQFSHPPPLARQTTNTLQPPPAPPQFSYPPPAVPPGRNPAPLPLPSLGQFNSTPFIHGQQIKKFLKNTETAEHEDDHTPRVMAQNKLQNWLTKKGMTHKFQAPKPKEMPDKRSISIPYAKSRLKEAANLSEKLNNLQQRLQYGIEDGSAEWESQHQEAQDVKRKLEEIKQKLNDEVMQRLTMKIKAVQKKRARIKRRRKEVYMEKEKEDGDRAELHRQLDHWKQQNVEKDLKEKREKEMKAAADEILSEVRKKLVDMRKMQQLLEGLQKLRQLRKTSLESKGFPPISKDYDRTFKARIKEQFALVKKQIEIYEAEQKTLEVMLEMEQDQTNVEARVKRQWKNEKRQRKIQKQVREMLFGKADKLPSQDPLYQYRQYYDLCNQSLDSFIQIRHEWDKYMVPGGIPGGSQVPPGWVVPAEPSSEAWAQALNSEQKQT